LALPRALNLTITQLLLACIFVGYIGVAGPFLLPMLIIVNAGAACRPANRPVTELWIEL
jgi:hypothetical protein